MKVLDIFIGLAPIGDHAKAQLRSARATFVVEKIQYLKEFRVAGANLLGLDDVCRGDGAVNARAGIMERGKHVAAVFII